MEEITCSFLELFWRDFFKGKEIEYEDENGVSSWETINDLHFVPKLRSFTITAASGKVFTCHKDKDYTFRVSEKSDLPKVTVRRNKGKKRNK